MSHGGTSVSPQPQDRGPVDPEALAKMLGGQQRGPREQTLKGEITLPDGRKFKVEVMVKTNKPIDKATEEKIIKLVEDSAFFKEYLTTASSKNIGTPQKFTAASLQHDKKLQDLYLRSMRALKSIGEGKEFTITGGSLERVSPTDQNCSLHAVIQSNQTANNRPLLEQNRYEAQARRSRGILFDNLDGKMSACSPSAPSPIVMNMEELDNLDLFLDLISSDPQQMMTLFDEEIKEAIIKEKTDKAQKIADKIPSAADDKERKKLTKEHQALIQEIAKIRGNRQYYEKLKQEIKVGYVRAILQQKIKQYKDCIHEHGALNPIQEQEAKNLASKIYTEAKSIVISGKPLDYSILQYMLNIGCFFSLSVNKIVVFQDGKIVSVLCKGKSQNDHSSQMIFPEKEIKSLAAINFNGKNHFDAIKLDDASASDDSLRKIFEKHNETVKRRTTERTIALLNALQTAITAGSCADSASKKRVINYFLYDKQTTLCREHISTFSDIILSLHKDYLKQIFEGKLTADQKAVLELIFEVKEARDDIASKGGNPSTVDFI